MKPLSVQSSNSIIFQNDDREVKRDKSEMPESRIKAREKIAEHRERLQQNSEINYLESYLASE